MNTKFAAVSALTGGLLFLASLQGTAYSANPSPFSIVRTMPLLSLVMAAEAGGRWWRRRCDGSCWRHGWRTRNERRSDGSCRRHACDGSHRRHGGGRNMHAGAMAHNGGTGRQPFAEGPHGNHFDRGDRDRFVAREAHSHKRFAERDFDHDRDFDHGPSPSGIPKWCLVLGL